MSSDTVSRIGQESVPVSADISSPLSPHLLPPAKLGDGASTSLSRPAEKPATVIVTLNCDCIHNFKCSQLFT